MNERVVDLPAEPWAPLVAPQGVVQPADDEPVLPRSGEDNSFFRNFGLGWVQSSGTALRGEDALDRARAFEGLYRPPAVPGYSPFTDTEQLRGFEADMDLFAQSQSPAETEFIRRQIVARRARSRELDGASFLTQFLAGNLTPEALVTAGIGIGILGAVTRTGRAVQAGWRVGALGAAQGAGEAAFRDSTLPREARGSILQEAAFGGMFGIALGGTMGFVSRGTLADAARRFHADQSAFDGPAAPRAGSPPASSRADGVIEPARSPENEGSPGFRPDDAALPRAEDDPNLQAAREGSPRPAGENSPEAEAAAPAARQAAGEYSPPRRDPVLARLGEPEIEARIQDVDARLAELEGRAPDADGAPAAQPRLPDDPEVAALRQERDALEAESYARRGDDPVQEVGPDGEPLPPREAEPELDGVAMVREPTDEIASVLDTGKAPDPEDVRAEAGAGAGGAAASLPPPGASGAPPPPDAPPGGSGGGNGGGGAVPPGAPGSPLPASAAVPEPDRIADGSGAGAIRWSQMPWYVLKNNRFTGPLANSIARMADELVMAPLTRMRGNADGVASETSSVEATARQQAWRFVEAERFQRELYYRYRGWNPEQAGDVRSGAVELKENLFGIPEAAKARGTPLTFQEFDQAVGLAITSPVGPKEAQEAAAHWRTHFYEPMEEAGARVGAILTAKHKDAGMAALARERVGIESRLEEVQANINRLARIDPAVVAQAAKDQPKLDAAWDTLREQAGKLRRARADLAAAPDSNALKRALAQRIRAHEAAEARMKALSAPSNAIKAARAELRKTPAGEAWLEEEFHLQGERVVNEARTESLREQRPLPEPYVPHVWVREKVRAQRDRLVGILEKAWTAPSGMTWATPGIRAEIAVSHLNKDGIGETLERVIARHLREGGLADDLAMARARELSGPTRAAVAKTEPGRLKVEWASLNGRNLPDPDTFGVAELVDIALAKAGVRGAPGNNPVSGLATGTTPTRPMTPGPASEGELQRLVLEIMGGDGSTKGDRWSDFARPGHSKERQIDVPTKDIAEFLDLSQRTGAIDYAKRIGTAIEMGEKMGDPSMLGRLSSNRIEMLKAAEAGNGTVDAMRAVDQASKDLRDKLLGTFRIPEDPDAVSVRVVRGLVNAAIMAQMGKGVISVVTDLGRISMAVGFRRVWRGIMEGNPVFGTEFEGYSLGGLEAARAGSASELSLLDRANAVYDRQHVGAGAPWVERALQGGASTMMFVNMMAPATQLGQRFAGALIQSEIVELALKAATTRLDPAEVARFAAYGFSPDDARRIAAEYRAAGAGLHGSLRLMNTEAWADKELVKRVRGALATAVDLAVIRPNIADRPNFMSTPLMRGMLLYRSFSVAATQRIMMSGLQQRDAYVVGGVLSSIALAWLFGGATGGQHDKNPIMSGSRLVAAVERSGVSGLFSDLNTAVEMMSENRYGVRAGLRELTGSTTDFRPPPHMRNVTWAQQASQVGGAAIAPWLNLTWAMTSPDAKNSLIGSYIRRAVPFNNLIWWDDAMGAVTRQATTSLLGSDARPRQQRVPASGL